MISGKYFVEYSSLSMDLQPVPYFEGLGCHLPLNTAVDERFKILAAIFGNSHLFAAL